MSDRADSGTPPPHPSALEPPGPAARRRRHRWLVVGAVGGAISVLTLLLGFGLSRDPTVVRSALVGKPAPEFDLRTLDGTGSLRLSDLRGQVVVLNFWASWCTACRVEHPALQAAWDRYRDLGVVVVGVAFEDRPSDSIEYLGTYGGDWPQLSDPDARAALAFGVGGVPETFVIGPDGRVVWKQIGPVSYDRLVEQVDRARSEASA